MVPSLHRRPAIYFFKNPFFYVIMTTLTSELSNQLAIDIPIHHLLQAVRLIAVMNSVANRDDNG